MVLEFSEDTLISWPLLWSLLHEISHGSLDLTYFRHMTNVRSLEKSFWILNLKWHFYHSPFPCSFFFLNCTIIYLSVLFIFIFIWHTVYSLFVYCLLLQLECKLHESRDFFFFFNAIYPHRGTRCTKRLLKRKWLNVSRTLILSLTFITSPF